MKLYMKCIRNGQESYSSHNGMSEEIICTLLEELGCSNIQVITEEDFNLAQGE